MNQIRWKPSKAANDGPILSYFAYSSFLLRAKRERVGEIQEAQLDDTKVYLIKSGKSAVFCDRAVRIEARTLDAIAASVFRELPDVEYLEFPDLLDAGPDGLGDCWRFRTQECTRLVLDPGWRDFNPSFAKRIRYSYKRLKREHGEDGVKLQFTLPGMAENIHDIIALNRSKIESKKKRYGIDEDYENAIVAACCGTGADVSLFVSDHLIAGAVFYICKGSAFLQAVGYDATFAKYSPSLICLNEGIKKIHSLGIRNINLMWGGGAYKERLGGNQEPLLSKRAIGQPTRDYFGKH